MYIPLKHGAVYVSVCFKLPLNCERTMDDTLPGRESSDLDEELPAIETENAKETLLYARESEDNVGAQITVCERKTEVSEAKVSEDYISLLDEHSRNKGSSDRSLSRLPEYHNSYKTTEANLNSDFLIPKILPVQPFAIRSDILDPILAVHSNEFVEKKREDIRQFARKLNPTFTITNLMTDPTLSRPKWPFSPWNSSQVYPHINPDAFLSELDKTYDPHERSECHRNNILGDILDVERQNVDLDFVHYVFEKADDAFCTEFSFENEKIRQDVRTILETACGELSKKHLIFRTFSVMEMGSVKEGTKLGPPDEFDFMIDLPSLNDALEFFREGTFYQDHENRDVRVTRRDLFRDFEDLSEEEIQGGDDKSFMRRVWNVIQIELANTMEDNVLPGWTWLDTVPPFTTLAQTQKMLWKGEKFQHLIVDIDVCICVKPSEFKTNIDFNQDIFDKSRPGIHDKGSSKTEQSLQNIYILLKSDGKARWTRALLEKEIWARFTHNDGRKKVLRYLKYFNLRFLPKCYNESLFRLDPALPSYWLKTIMYYLITWYHEDSCWSPDNLSHRFVEVWFILKECLNKKCLSSYFVPHNIISKFCPPFASEKNEYQILMREISKVTNEYLFQKLDKHALTKIENEIEIKNLHERDQGIFSSVIELCYLYAYNDFADENRKALQSFITELGNGQFTVEGEGNAFKLLYRGAIVDINRNISEKYGVTKSYFS
ncbi:uncharacterized protein LOC130052518 [Ostrea edulis]|uniref:uncharacterized protein LOC130052518 n=1 Tax=Ostrea edulis TaxID=37623 RepID=UPI0024AFCA81|nr:uncharacterized protein LOC130052518 [Ostrea edulis]